MSGSKTNAYPSVPEERFFKKIHDKTQKATGLTRDMYNTMFHEQENMEEGNIIAFNSMVSGRAVYDIENFVEVFRQLWVKEEEYSLNKNENWTCFYEAKREGVIDVVWSDKQFQVITKNENGKVCMVPLSVKDKIEPENKEYKERKGVHMECAVLQNETKFTWTRSFYKPIVKTKPERKLVPTPISIKTKPTPEQVIEERKEETKNNLLEKRLVNVDSCTWRAFHCCIVKTISTFVCSRPTKRSPNGDMKFGKIL